ncbi:dTMP kinase [Microbacterium aurum]
MFIVLEGLDGAGTTTQTRLLSAHLRQWGFETWTTREPSAGPFGKAARSVIEGDETLPPAGLALGFAADRIHHMFKPDGIEEMLARGVWVITDRYVLSSLAYQSAQGLDLNWLIEINRAAPTPDVTVFLDTSVRVCLERIQARGENLEDKFHQRTALLNTRRQYLHALSSGLFVGKLVTADGNGSKADVLQQILRGMAEELQTDLGVFGGMLSQPPRGLG